MRMRWSDVHRKQVVFFPAPDAKRMASRSAVGVRNRGRRASVIESEERALSLRRPAAFPILLRAGNRRAMLRADRRERKVKRVG